MTQDRVAEGLPAAQHDRAQRREELTDLLVQTSFGVMGALTRIAAEHDVSLTQLRVFGILRDHRPRMAELAEFLGLEKSTMSGLINRAERRGLIERVPDRADARATAVVMTAAGLELAERAQGQVREALAPMIDRLGDTAWTTLDDLLSRMLEPAPGT